MDTFAFRRPETLKQLEVFEVDHPDTQTFKRQRIAELGWECSPSLHFVPVNFISDSLTKALLQSSYDPTVLSFFSWLGVTYYLPQDAVFDTLRSIADIASAGSMVVFDYYDTDIFDSEKVHPIMKTAMQNLRRQGEPLKTAFTATILATELANVGLHLHAVGPE
jgi:methyltransferase (TIGR00027 family)